MRHAEDRGGWSGASRREVEAVTLEREPSLVKGLQSAFHPGREGPKVSKQDMRWRKWLFRRVFWKQVTMDHVRSCYDGPGNEGVTKE